MKWLYQNVKYPEICIENGIEGRVQARFTVSRSGKVSDIIITRSVHPGLDEEVIRVLNIMPDFRPAMKKGQLVPVHMNVPVVFDLQ